MDDDSGCMFRLSDLPPRRWVVLIYLWAMVLRRAPRDRATAVTKRQLEEVFKKVNSGREEFGGDDNAADELTRFEFLESIIEIAVLKYGSIKPDPSSNFEMLLNSCVLPEIESLSTGHIRKCLQSEEMRSFMADRLPQLKAVFDIYSAMDVGSEGKEGKEAEAASSVMSHDVRARGRSHPCARVCVVLLMCICFCWGARGDCAHVYILVCACVSARVFCAYLCVPVCECFVECVLCLCLRSIIGFAGAPCRSSSRCCGMRCC
jgi:hypothetical protein